MQLSENLALRISHALGIMDKDWLLKNDLKAPLPKWFQTLKPDSNADTIRASHTIVLTELFSRLFSVVATMEQDLNRKMIEMDIEYWADFLRRQKEPDQDGHPHQLAGSKSIELFVRHPDLFDPNLRSWVNLKGLLKSNLELSTPWVDAPDEIDQRAKEAEQGLQKSLEIDRRVAEELRRKREYTNASEPTRPPQASPKPRPPKAPSRNPELPSPGGRGKKPKSS